MNIISGDHHPSTVKIFSFFFHFNKVSYVTFHDIVLHNSIKVASRVNLFIYRFLNRELDF